MSPVVYRDDSGFAWGTLVLVLVVLLVIFMVGYFAWYQPAGTGPSTTVIAPSTTPVPGPAEGGPTTPFGSPMVIRLNCGR